MTENIAICTCYTFVKSKIHTFEINSWQNLEVLSANVSWLKLSLFFQNKPSNQFEEFWEGVKNQKDLGIKRTCPKEISLFQELGQRQDFFQHKPSDL